MKVRPLGACLALASLLAGATAVSDSAEREPARAQPAGAIHGSRAAVGASHEPRVLAASIAAPWVSRQSANGSFPDYMAARGSRSRDVYGEAMLGYGLLKTGLQRRDGPTVNSGLRALVHAVATPRTSHSVVFENLALAAGYNLARESVPRHPLFAASRARWEARLSRMKSRWLGRGPYFNQHLVDAVAVMELARSGVRSRLPGTVSSDPQLARRLAERLVNSRLSARLRPRTAGSAHAGTTTLASDGALAYHAVTLGFYARAVELLGRRAPRHARDRFSAGSPAPHGRSPGRTGTSRTSAVLRNRRRRSR